MIAYVDFVFISVPLKLSTDYNEAARGEAEMTASNYRGSDPTIRLSSALIVESVQPWTVASAVFIVIAGPGQKVQIVGD